MLSGVSAGYLIVGVVGSSIVVSTVTGKLLVRTNRTEYIAYVEGLLKLGLLGLAGFLGLGILQQISSFSGLTIPYVSQIIEFVKNLL